MKFYEFKKIIDDHKDNAPVILLEGKRNVIQNDKKYLTFIGNLLSSLFPNCIFRTGNATGADELFASGVAENHPSALQFILPYSKHRVKNRIEKAHYFSADAISIETDPIIYEATINANKKYSEMFKHHASGIKNSYTIKAPYLLRDTIKVLGSKTLGLSPATFALFYDDLVKPLSGGTGHTMKVCIKNNVLFVDQRIWNNWIEDFIDEEMDTYRDLVLLDCFKNEKDA